MTTVNTAIEVVRDGASDGAANMAADAALLERAAAQHRVILRLYTWDPATVSLGWMQDAQSVLDLAAMARDGIGWVHRPTGGRAVLHRDDLTYSIVIPDGSGEFGGTIAQTYHVLSRWLIDGLARAGIAADTHDSQLDAALVRREGKLPCFLAPNRDEIMVDGRKLVGSAQRRTSLGVLQHGSIAVGPAFRDLPRYLVLEEPQRRAYTRLLDTKCTCASEVVRGISTNVLAGSLADAFTSAFGSTQQ